MIKPKYTYKYRLRGEVEVHTHVYGSENAPLPCYRDSVVIKDYPHDADELLKMIEKMQIVLHKRFMRFIGAE
jgi:hypothetical protein